MFLRVPCSRLRIEQRVKEDIEGWLEFEAVGEPLKAAARTSGNLPWRYARRGTKFTRIARYEVELYGAVKKIQLPFVMGVMADL